MTQVVLESFYWTSFRPRDGKYRRIRFIFSIREASLVIFCSRQGTRLTSVQFVVFNPLWSFRRERALRESTVAGFHVLVFQKRGRGRTMSSSVTGPDSSCRPVRVRRSQIVSSPALSRLLFCGRRQLFFPFSLGLSRKHLKLYLPQ